MSDFSSLEVLKQKLPNAADCYLFITAINRVHFCFSLSNLYFSYATSQLKFFFKSLPYFFPYVYLNSTKYLQITTRYSSLPESFHVWSYSETLVSIVLDRKLWIFILAFLELSLLLIRVGLSNFAFPIQSSTT